MRNHGKSDLSLKHGKLLEFHSQDRCLIDEMDKDWDFDFVLRDSKCLSRRISVEPPISVGEAEPKSS